MEIEQICDGTKSRFSEIYLTTKIKVNFSIKASWNLYLMLIDENIKKNTRDFQRLNANSANSAATLGIFLNLLYFFVFDVFLGPDIFLRNGTIYRSGS